MEDVVVPTTAAAEDAAAEESKRGGGGGGGGGGRVMQKAEADDGAREDATASISSSSPSGGRGGLRWAAVLREGQRESPSSCRWQRSPLSPFLSAWSSPAAPLVCFLSEGRLRFSWGSARHATTGSRTPPTKGGSTQSAAPAEGTWATHDEEGTPPIPSPTPSPVLESQPAGPLFPKSTPRSCSSGPSMDLTTCVVEHEGALAWTPWPPDRSDDPPEEPDGMGGGARRE